jgi:hypothetical protein
MNIDFRLLIILWGVLAASVLVLLVWRKTVARNEDDQLHVLNTAVVANQAELAHKLEVIDKWGKIVTAVTFAFGALIAGLFLYQTWVQTSTTIPGA